jgi:hypothetical protein
MKSGVVPGLWVLRLLLIKAVPVPGVANITSTRISSSTPGNKHQTRSYGYHLCPRWDVRSYPHAYGRGGQGAMVEEAQLENHVHLSLYVLYG